MIDPRPYPMTAHLPRRKDGQPRTLDGSGVPIWRVSYTDRDGQRRLTFVAKPCLRWAKTWAARMSQVHHWQLPIIVGRWHGALPQEPTPVNIPTNPRKDTP
jgi:hypothetical protein